jgi:hypothetical protein
MHIPMLGVMMILIASCSNNNKQAAQTVRRADLPVIQKAPLINNPKEVIRRIFDGYKAQEESTEFEDHLDSMRLSFETLTEHADPTALPLLLDVWMYYDPTDFPTRSLIEPILSQDSTNTLIAIKRRLGNKYEWEDDASLADLLSLKGQYER